MKKSLLGSILLVAIVALVVSASVAAADDATLFSKPPVPKATLSTNNLPSPALPAPKPSSSSTYNWSGFYGGVNVGWGIGRTGTTFTPLPDATTFFSLLPQTLTTNASGPLGGGQFGYQCERGHVVFGPIVDFDWTGMNGSVFVTPIIQNNSTAFPGSAFLTTTQSVKWIGSIRGKFGVLIGPRFQIYGTGGYAFSRGQYDATTDFQPVGTTVYRTSFDKVSTGWTVGGGGEFAVGPVVRIGGEYLYYSLGNQSVTVNPVPALPPFQVNYLFTNKYHVIRAVINLRF